MPKPIPPAHLIEQAIHTVRGQKVIFDSDLARVYGVETRALNQALKRNAERFPPEFAFPLTREEILSISQSVISLSRLKFSKRVHAFTEHGALMAATVLNSPQAITMSLFLVRAFVKMRHFQSLNDAILKRLAEIDSTLLAHDGALREIFEKLLPLLDAPEPGPQRQIGFHVKDQLSNKGP